jgi:hypothetical protein
LTPDVLADDDLARINRGLDARSRINAITVEVAVCVYSNIANVNTNAQIVCATSSGGLFAKILAQCGCGVRSHFSAWKLGENRVPEKFNDATLVAFHDVARERLQDFNQLQRAAFVSCSAFAVARDVGKPERDEMMG